ncbi:hypothetical protein [Streptomyces flaveolus]|uniref:hypothetical protein n=1 Tax=Streptomyces flaveolus TaxID=67297 RepID=UPI0036FBBE20
MELGHGALLFAVEGVEDDEACGSGRHRPLDAGELALGADKALVLAAEAAGLFQDDDDAHDSAFR